LEEKHFTINLKNGEWTQAKKKTIKRAEPEHFLRENLYNNQKVESPEISLIIRKLKVETLPTKGKKSKEENKDTICKMK
jgi:hypothetical protein